MDGGYTAPEELRAAAEKKNDSRNKHQHGQLTDKERLDILWSIVVG